MVGPAASVQGGMRTVVNQYLSYENWKSTGIRYIPTYVEASNLKKLLFFGIQMIKADSELLLPLFKGGTLLINIAD